MAEHKMIPCANARHGCKRTIPLARREIAGIDICGPCNTINLTAYKRANTPEYETEVWSRGERFEALARAGPGARPRNTGLSAERLKGGAP